MNNTLKKNNININAKRIPGESFIQYKKRLKNIKIVLKKYLKGHYFWKNSQDIYINWEKRRKKGKF